MGISDIKFYDEKKAVVTNILDAAVKTLEFDQKSYIQTKRKLMEIIEKPGFEGLGLGEIVSISNKMIAKIAESSGYIIVDSNNNSAAKTAANKEAKRKELDEELRQKVVPSSVSRTSSSASKKTEEPSIKGKEKLLQLMRLLPPLITMKEMELYSAQIRKARLGPPTGANPPRTTGDFEVVISAELIENYSLEFDSLVRKQPKAFIESVEMVSGSMKDIDVSDKLRKQLSRTRSVAEFLSIRDLVDRHIKDNTKPIVEKTKTASLFFWRKE